MRTAIHSPVEEAKMPTRTCGTCTCYKADQEPDGYRNGMGYCVSLATKRIGGEFRTAVGAVEALAPACGRYSTKTPVLSSAVDALLDPPPLPAGVMIERVIEVQGGRCAKQQDTMFAGSPHTTVGLNGDQRRICELQVAAALADTKFHGKVTLIFGDKGIPSLAAWSVRAYPPGGEIRT